MLSLKKKKKLFSLDGSAFASDIFTVHLIYQCLQNPWYKLFHEKMVTFFYFFIYERKDGDFV